MIASRSPSPTPPGRSCPIRARSFGNFGGLGSFQAAQARPNVHEHHRSDPLPRRRRAGVYTVRCSFAFDEPDAVKKGPAKPVVQSRFHLTILERTPERVAKSSTNWSPGPGRRRAGTSLPPSPGRPLRTGDAVPRLVRLAERGPVPRVQRPWVRSPGAHGHSLQRRGDGPAGRRPNHPGGGRGGARGDGETACRQALLAAHARGEAPRGGRRSGGPGPQSRIVPCLCSSARSIGAPRS